MPKLPRLPSKKVLRALNQAGFYQARQRGSHIVLRKNLPDGTNRGCVVPQGYDPIPIGTLANILKQAGLTTEEFLSYL